MIRSIHKLARARAREQSGVIALATFVFCTTAGGMILLGLWGIAYISGAYNALYAATQSAALSSVTATRSSAENQGFTQLTFDCGGRSARDTACSSGPTVEAAQKVFEAMFAPGQPGTYGMRYSPNSPGGLGQIHLVDSSLNYSGRDQVNVYEVFTTPAASRNNCELRDGQTVDFYINDPNSTNNSVICWRMIEFGNDFQPNYTSAVVVRSTVLLPAIPFCNANFCPIIKLNAASAASQAQPRAPARYGDYFS